MIELTTFEQVHKGDVILVEQPFIPKGTTKVVRWRWFGVVGGLGKGKINMRLHRAGGPPDAKPKVFVRGDVHRDIQLQLLDPDEWPDGVHMFRTQMILRGEIDID